jgi:hypothetical protein
MLPGLLLLSFGLFLLIGEQEPAKKEEKDPEQELGEAIAKYLKNKGNG